MTAAVIWLRVDVSSAETFFRVAAAFSQGACRASLQQICTFFFFFGFNLKFVRWAAGEGGACKFCAIEGRILLRKWFRLIFGTILVEPRGLNANGTKILG